MALFRMPRLDGRELAAIFAGGSVGAMLRAGLAEATAPPPGRWPWPTFAANIAGALLLGYLVTRLQERLPLSAYRRPLLGTGLCGALTTFRPCRSSWSGCWRPASSGWPAGMRPPASAAAG